MRLILQPLALLCALVWLVGCGSTGAPPGSPVVAPASARIDSPSGAFSGSAAQQAMFDRLVYGEGFDRGELERLFARVERQPWIIELMDRQVRPAPPGPTGVWTRYRARFVTQDNISNGTAFWRRHATALDRASERYGVPPEYIVAIIGVETRYGGYLGNTRIIDALATLAFDYPRRADYFTRELEAFLIMSRDEGFDPLTPRGSYAGAMGLGQFMPSSFHGYAVDFDGDGHRDLWNPVDAIGSVANYLSGHGWRRGEPVVVRARATGYPPRSQPVGFNTGYSLDRLRGMGIVPTGSVTGQQEVSLLELDVGSGYEYWLGLHNFFVITRYNHSTHYAMAVHQLAQALRDAQVAAGRLVSQGLDDAPVKRG